MIKVVKNDNLITITGHSGMAEYGKDIVCAGVSSIIYTTINAISRLRENAIEVKDNNEKMIIKINTKDEIVEELIINMLELLKSVANDYPKNLNVKEN